LFGGPGEVVRSERLPRIWKVSGRITGDQGIQEGTDESSVAATVTIQSLGHLDGRDRDALASTGAEVEQVEHLAVALDAPVGAEQLRLAELIAGESRSGEARRDATLVFDGHDLVIDDVVVAGIDATAVQAVPQGREDTFDGKVGRDRLQRPALQTAVAQTGQIDLWRGYGQLSWSTQSTQRSAASSGR
jgi:hypothetical protein